MSLPIVDPIVPSLSRDLPRGADWRYELKLDGFRGTLYVEGRRAWFRSKKNHLMHRFDDLALCVAGELAVGSAIIDGEIVVMGEHGPDFYALMFRRGTPQFAAFDLLWRNGRDLRGQTYASRKAALRRLIDPRARFVSYVEEHVEAALLEAAQRMDLEGVVAKNRREAYAAGSRWIKVKCAGYSQAAGRGELFHPPRSSSKYRRAISGLAGLV